MEVIEAIKAANIASAESMFRMGMAIGTVLGFIFGYGYFCVLDFLRYLVGAIKEKRGDGIQ